MNGASGNDTDAILDWWCQKSTTTKQISKAPRFVAELNNNSMPCSQSTKEWLGTHCLRMHVISQAFCGNHIVTYMVSFHSEDSKL